MSAEELAGDVAHLLYCLRGWVVEDRREVSRWSLMSPILARRRKGGGGRGAEEVDGWRRRFSIGDEARWPGGESGGGSFR
jgi:hypothetical protein